MANAVVADLCSRLSEGSPEARGRLLARLGQGAHDVVWALCSMPLGRWLVAPPQSLRATLGPWPAARHVRHLALYETCLGLPALRDWDHAAPVPGPTPDRPLHLSDYMESY
jgi:hypothetical protein